MPGKVYVTCKRGTDLQKIYSFVERKGKWILNALSKYNAMPRYEETIKKLSSGEKFLLFGKMLEVKFVISENFYVRFDDEFIYIYGKAENVIKNFQAWMKNFARNTLQQMLEENFKKFERFDLKLPVLQIKKMKSRWGSCNPKKGIINLNFFLIKVEKQYIDFVICHEIAHLVYIHHDKNFYRLLESVVPGSGILKKELDFKYASILRQD